MSNKKILSLALLILLVSSISGCNKSDKSNNDSKIETVDDTAKDTLKENKEDLEMEGAEVDDYEENEIEEEMAPIQEGLLVYYEGVLIENNKLHFIENYFKEGEKKPNYNDLVRYPQEWVGKVIELNGRVTDVLTENSNYYVLQVDTSFQDSYSRPVVIDYVKNYHAPRIIEGDNVHFWGYYAGINTFTNGFGETILMPTANADLVISGGFGILQYSAAIKDFDNGIIYAIRYNNNFLTAFDDTNKIKWEYERIDGYISKSIKYSDDGKITVKALQLKDSKEVEIILDSQGNILKKPDGLGDIIKNNN